MDHWVCDDSESSFSLSCSSVMKWGLIFQWLSKFSFAGTVTILLCLKKIFFIFFILRIKCILKNHKLFYSNLLWKSSSAVFLLFDKISKLCFANIANFHVSDFMVNKGITLLNIGIKFWRNSSMHYKKLIWNVFWNIDSKIYLIFVNAYLNLEIYWFVSLILIKRSFSEWWITSKWLLDILIHSYNIFLLH